MREADAVIILCNKKCVNPEEEDAANTTRFVESFCRILQINDLSNLSMLRQAFYAKPV